MKMGGNLSPPIFSSDCQLLLALADGLAVGVVIDIPIGVHISCRSRLYRVTKIADGLLYLALYLLGSSVDLRTRVAGPLTNLALHAARRIIQCSLHLIVIHMYPPP